MRTAWYVAGNILVLIGLLWAYRFVHRRSRLAGLTFAAGLLIRGAGAAFFLTISSYALPFMAASQMGGGFWLLAPDAQEYYRLTLLVLEQGASTITIGYTWPLAQFMRLVGPTPAAPVLFALVSHAAAVVAVVAAFGRNRTRGADKALLSCVAAFSCSPMLVYAGMFGLKDVFSTTLVVIFTVGYLMLLTASAARATVAAILPAASALAAYWLLAGIRAYLVILLWAAVAVTYAACAIARIPSRRRAVLQAAAVLPILALVIVFASEGNYPRYLGLVATSIPAAVVTRQAPLAHGGIDEFDRRREAIDSYGGDSMLTPQVSQDETPSRLRGLAVGLGAVFVPISVLDALSIVDMHLGRLAHLVADADTLFLDVTALVAFWLLAVNRARVAPAPVMFAVAVTLAVALPLAYVMTNYGTLVRLRLMVAAPIWLVTLALAPRFAAGRATPGPDPAVTST